MSNCVKLINRPLALPSGLCYIETANLDGETNLKVHESLKDTLQFSDTFELCGTVECEVPNNRLYVFEGTLHLASGEKMSVSNKNVILRGSVVRNVPFVVGIVTYTGKDSKIVRNSVAPPSKRSSLERQMDVAIAVIFVCLLAICATAGVASQLRPHHERWYIHLDEPAFAYSGTVLAALFGIASYIILFNQMIPLSLYVTYEYIYILF